jgi:hypothetical protein
LTQLAQEAWQPVPDYNTWIGVWGQPEAIAQEKLLMELTREVGIEVKTPGWMRFRDAERLLQAIQSRQRFAATPWKFKSANGGFLGSGDFMLWPVEKFRDRLQLLVDNGVVEETGDGTCQLANWEEYRLR